MSDTYISIVPKAEEYPNRLQKSKEILSWLFANDIIETEMSDCVLGADYGYAVAQGAKNVVTAPTALPFGQWTKGLEVILDKELFHPGDNLEHEGHTAESDLGFTFWNWPSFNQDFLKDFREHLGMEIEVIFGRIEM